MPELRAFACRVRGETYEHVINHRTRGKAKAEYFLHVEEIGAKWTDIRVRCLGAPETTDDIRRTAEYRGVPFARAGMRVVVGEDYGVIVGHNSSANFDVLFDYDSKYPGQVLNCHPNWQIAYFDEEGTVLKDFRSVEVVQ